MCTIFALRWNLKDCFKTFSDKSTQLLNHPILSLSHIQKDWLLIVNKITKQDYEFTPKLGLIIIDSCAPSDLA